MYVEPIQAEPTKVGYDRNSHTMYRHLANKLCKELGVYNCNYATNLALNHQIQSSFSILGTVFDHEGSILTGEYIYHA